MFSNPLIITQARLASTRLPNKVLIEILGKPLLKYHLDRLSESKIKFCVATSNSKSNKILLDYLHINNICYYSGSESDVLSRYYECAKANCADIIIRVTSDCPLIDGTLIREALDLYIEQDNCNLYLSNTVKRTYPRGLDIEVFSFEMLERAHFISSETCDREHVTTYMRRNSETEFSNYDLCYTRDASRFRITVDEAADLVLINKLITDHQCHLLNYHDIISVLERNPELVKLNCFIEQKKSLGST